MRMNQGIPTLVIIDPYHAVPETDAINTILRIVYKTTVAMRRSFAIQVITPAHPQKGTIAALNELHPVGIISLGSVANVTDNLQWFSSFERIMQKWVVSEQVPFLGICFTHQYIAKMYGSTVDYLKRRREIKCGRHNGARLIELLHPKLRLYFASLPDSALGSENKADLNFSEALRFSHSLNQHGWNVIQNTPIERLHPQEARLHQFLESHCPKTAYFAVAHEQEVHTLPNELVLGASSVDCKFEALISENQEFMTFQAHPEYEVNLPDGKRLIRNFIYSLCI